MVIWDWLNNLYHKRYRYPLDEEVQGKLWTINRFVSFDPDMTDVVAEVSKYFFVLKERYYRLLYRIIPESPSIRLKNLKPQNEFDNPLVKRYSKVYGLSAREITDYLKILRKTHSLEEIQNFVGMESK